MAIELVRQSGDVAVVSTGKLTKVEAPFGEDEEWGGWGEEPAPEEELEF